MPSPTQCITYRIDRYASNLEQNEEEDCTLPMFLQLKIIAQTLERKLSPTKTGRISSRSFSNDEVDSSRSVESGKASSVSSLSSGITIPVHFSEGICAAVRRARFTVETKRRISMEISSHQAKLNTIDEEEDMNEEEENELRNIHWRSSYLNSSSDLDLKITLCIPRAAENVSVAQFSTIHRHLSDEAEDNDDDDDEEEEETVPISKIWSEQLSCVRILRDNITDVMSSHFLRLMSESSVSDVVARREEIMMHLNRDSKTCLKKKIPLKFAYFPRSFELDMMMNELISKAKEISDVVELVTPRSILMRSRPLDQDEEEEESSVVFTSIMIQDSKEVSVSVRIENITFYLENVTHETRVITRTRQEK